MKKAILGAVFAGVMALSAAPALAEAKSQIVFQHKHWQVEVIALDDGTMSCTAAVDGGSDSFTIWVFQDKSVRLQFYSTSWDFGEGQTADLQVAIGSRAPWNLTGAELYKNSVLFDLPDSDQGVNFLIEVAQGSRLYLRSADGSDVVDYSLAGSNASINALVECSDALSKGGDANPFN
ncbi:DUF1176 domain-containing protein [Fuscibacter oryzae]|uniref:Secreted protein n=1 Tax=Fuscibacter oryzae TaxID=2803939 RepID=A0A8J7SSH1_9RHOB|nr:hypothetical protein [Fuscibacter oryzae]MBL4926732.1 hypothetical protein [Fuscibacter oryzae]